VTIASTTSKVSYNGSGSTGPFSITFKFAKNADIVATKRSSAGVETVLTLTTHYTLTGAGEASGGALTLVTALAVGESLVIARVPGITQEVDYVENSAFPAETHEGALDLLTMICQSLQEQVDRAVKVDISSTTDPDDLLDELAADVLSAAASAATATTQAGLAATAKTQAEAARDATPAFDTIVGEAGSIPRVKVGETTLEFRTPSEVRSDIAAAASGANSNITSLSGLTTPLSVAQGGTSGATPAAARSALGLLGGTKNKLLNGAFRVNQRVYVSNTALAQGVPSTGVGYGHDGWRAGAGGCTYTFTQSSGPTTITITSGTLISKTEAQAIDQAQMVLSWTGTARGRYGVNNAEPSGAYADSPILITATVGESVAVEFDNGTLGLVQLENGTVPTEFEWLSIGSVLDLCRRMLPVFTDFLVNAHVATGQCYSATAAITPLAFKVTPRITPTGITVSDVAHFNTLNASATPLALSTLTLNDRCLNNVTLVATVASGLTAGHSTILRAVSTSAKITCTGAEL